MIRRVFGEVEHVAVPQDEEYLALVRDILENEQVRSMDGYFQHGAPPACATASMCRT